MAETTIERVQVQVEATAKGTGAVLSKVESQLKSVKNLLTGVSSAQKSIKNVSSVSVNTSSMSRSEKDITKSVNKIQQAIAGLNSYKNAALSGDSSSLTSFNRQVVSIQSQIDILKEKFNQLGNTSIPTDAFSKLEAEEKALESQISGLKAKIQEATSGDNTDSEALKGYESSLTEAEGKLDEVKTKQDELINSGKAYYDPFSGLRDSAEEAESTLASVKSEVAGIQNNSKNVKIQLTVGDAISILKSIASNAAKAAKKLLSLSSSAIKSGFSAVKNRLSGIKNTLTSIGSSASSKVSTGFSKILKYGFGIRSLYVLFRRLRTAVKDSFTELQNSGAYYQTTKANVEALKSALTTLKYQFGAAFEPIFNYVAPALQTLINYLVTVMNTISAFIAKLTGQSTYSKAVASTAAIASNTGSAAGSAAELNKQLQGFDELNNLSIDSGSSGSGGSGGSSDSSDVTYVTEQVSNSLSSFWSALADEISAGNWGTVGNMISTKLTEALNSINWNTAFEGAKNFGTNLANFLNGLITTDLFSALGTTIANAIKTALFAALSFSETFSWKGLGNAIAAGINSFVDENPLSLAVDTFNSWATGILDALIAAVRGIHWEQISTQIAEAIGKIKASEIMGKLGTLANEIANALYTVVSNKSTWTNLGTKMSEGISSFFTSMGKTDSSTGKNGWQALGSSISSSVGGFVDAITKALEDNKAEISKAIVDFFESLELKDLVKKLARLATTIVGALADAIKELWKDASLKEKIGAALVGCMAVATITLTALTSALKPILTPILGQALGNAITTGFGSQTVTANLGKGLTIIPNIAGYTIGAVVGWNLGLNGANLLVDIAEELGFDTGTYGDTVKWMKEVGFEVMLKDIIVGYKEQIIDKSFDGSSIYRKIATNNNWSYNERTGEFRSLKDGSLVMDIKPEINFKDGDVTDSVQNIWDKLKAKVLTSKSQTELNNIGTNITKGVTTGMTKEAKADKQSAEDAYHNIKSKLENAFDINSPAKKMYSIGENIFLGIIEGFKKEMGGYSFDDIAQTISEKLGLSSSTGLTAKGNFANSSDKTHNKTGDNKTTLTINTKLTGAVTTRQGLEDLKTSFNNLSTEASKSTEATYSAKTGGQLSDINALDTWRQKIRNLTSSWFGSNATMRASVGGQMTSIDDTETWIEKIQKLDQEWQNSASSTSFNVTSDVSNLDGAGGYLERLNKAKEEWKKNNPTATFTTTLSGSVTTTGGIDTLAGSFKTLKDNYPSGAHSSSWSTTISGASASTIDTYAKAAKNMYNSFYTGSYSATYTLSANVSASNLETIATELSNKIKKKLSGTTRINFTTGAVGGIIANGIMQHSIPQYAGGTLNAGSMFIAGEKGPEILGHINGRTEVLNKSQIAATMNAAVINGMRRFRNMSFATPDNWDYAPTTYNASNSGNSNDNATYEAIVEQNRILRRQNDLLEEIASKDMSISSRDVFKATQSEANNYYNRTGNSPFLY